MYTRTGGRGTIGKDVSRAGSGSRWAVRTSPHYTVEHSVCLSPFWRQTSSERRISIRGDCRVVVTHDDDGQATPDGVIVVTMWGCARS